jgi:hypothetical protein
LHSSSHEDGHAELKKAILSNTQRLPSSYAKLLFTERDLEPWQSEGSSTLADLRRINLGVAVMAVYPPQLQAETGQSGICVSIPWLLRTIANKVASHGRTDRARHLDAEAALYPDNPRSTPSWPLDWTPDPDCATNRFKGLREAEAILEAAEGNDEVAAARTWLAQFEWLIKGEAEGGFWNQQLNVDYKTLTVGGAQGIVTAIGSVMHALANHYDAEDPAHARELRRIADKYYLDDDLEIAVTSADGLEHGLYEFEWIGTTEALRLASVHADRLIAIPGSLEFRPHTALSRHSVVDEVELPFRCFLFIDPEDDDEDERVRCVIWSEDRGFIGYDDIDPALMNDFATATA